MNQVGQVTIFCVIHSSNEEDIQRVIQFFQSIDPSLGFSPGRESPSLNDCLEFYGSGRCTKEMKEQLLSQCNNDWDQEDNSYWAYGFNTKMFDEKVYYLSFIFS